MKFLKHFESFQKGKSIFINGSEIIIDTDNYDQFLKMHQLPEGDFSKLKTRLENVFNILGFKINFKENKTNTLAKSTILNYLIDINFDINSIPNSMLNIIARIGDGKFEPQLNTPLYLSCMDKRHNTTIVDKRMFKISARIEDLTDTGNGRIGNLSTELTASSCPKAFRLIMSEILEMFDEITNTIKINKTGHDLISILDLGKFVTNFIKANTNSTKLVIPDDTIRFFYDRISNSNGVLQIMHNIESTQPVLFDRLKSISDNISTASKLGEIGF